MIGIYIWRERYIPFGMIVVGGAKRGGRRCVRGWGDVSRWISAVNGKDWGIVPHRTGLIGEKK